MTRLNFVYFFIPLLATYFSTFYLRRLALKFEIVDTPGKRKIHKEPVPLLGGAAIFLGILIGLCFVPSAFKENLTIFIGSALILAVNLVDDIRELSARTRLLLESIIALGVIFCGIKVSFLPSGFWGDTTEIVITLIWLVGLTNAFNCLDGIDGLAAGLTSICAFYFAFILFGAQQFNLGFFSLILIGSSLGFLPHNFKKEKIFLGDAGSTFIGFTLAAIALRGNWAQDNFVRLAVPILVLGVPIFDMVFTTIMRIRERKIATIIEWLSYSGKDHFHHRLMNLGLDPQEAVLFIYFISICVGISAIMVSNEKAVVGFLSILQVSIIFAGVGVLMVMGRRYSKGSPR